MPQQSQRSNGDGVPAGAPAPLPPQPTSYEEASSTFMNTLYSTEPQQDSTGTDGGQPAQTSGQAAFAADADRFVRGIRFIGRAGKAIAKGAAEIITSPVQTARSAARGAVNAVDAVAETSAAATSWFLRKSGIGQSLIDDEYNFIYDQLGADKLAKEATSPLNTAEDAVLGKRSDSGAMQFVESTTQFLASFHAVGKLMPFLPTKGVPGLAAAALKGAIVDFAAFDPHEAQLAELAASSEIPGVSDLGKIMSVGEDEGPFVSRFKRSMSGLIVGSAIDGLVASARLLKHTKMLRSPNLTPAARAASEEVVAQEAKVLDDIGSGTHVPADDPVVVKPSEDGSLTLEVNKNSPTLLGLGEQEAQRMKQFDAISNEARELSVKANRTPEETARLKELTQQKQQFSDLLPDAPNGGGRESRITIDQMEAAVAREQAKLPPSMRAPYEAQAATINEALAYRFRAGAQVTGKKMDEVFSLAKQIEEAKGDPDKIVQLFSEARFNFTYMDAPAKVESLLKSIGEKLSPVFDRTQGRPVVTIDESVERAMELAGMLTREDAKEYLARTSDVLKNTDAHLLLINSRVMELGEQVAKWGTILEERPLDVVAMTEARKALRTYINTAADVAGSNSGVGRGLNALKFRDRLSAADVKFKGEQGAVGAAGKELAPPDIVAGMTVTELKDVTRLFRMSKQPKVLFNTLASEIKPKNMGKVRQFGRGMLEYFYNSVLSSPATHAAIFLGNGTVSLMEDGVRVLAGAVRRDPEMVREATDILMGRMIYLKQSVQGMGMALKAGRSIIDPKPVYKAIPGVGGEIVRTMGTRPIAAMDEFWRVNNNLAFVRSQSLKLARREATAKGLTGKKMDEFLAARVDADIRTSIDPETGASRLSEARRFAALPTFSSPLEPGSFGSSLEKLVQDHPFLVPIMPFVRTSINVMDYGFVKSSPLGLFSKNMREAIQKGGPEGAILATRMGVGTTLWATAGLLAFTGDITGRGPTDPRLRQMWLANHQPYSLKIGGKWVSYRRVEPFATMLGVAADLAHILRDNADDLAVQEEGSKVFYAIVASTVSGMTNKTYMSGLVNFMDAVGSGDGGKVKGFIDRTVGAAIPNVLAGTDTDPYMRQTRGMFDALVNRTWWSGSLPAKYNVFGEPLLSEPGRIQRNLNPFPVKDGGPSTEDEFLALDRAFLPPPTYQKFGNLVVNLHDRKYQNRNGGKLTPYERLMEIVDSKNLRGQIDKVVSSPAYQRSGDGTEVFAGGRKYTEIRDRIDRVYAKAQRQMLSEYPELKKELKGLNRARRASARSDTKAEGLLGLIR